MRALDLRDFVPFRDSTRSDIQPGLPAITREMNEACITAGPNLSSAKRRGRNRVDDTIASLFSILECNRPFRFTAIHFFRARQIGTDSLPVQSAIDGLHDILRSEID